MTTKRNIIRAAVAIAIEGLPGGDLLEWVVLAKQRDAMRKHVIAFVHDFAKNRGVLLSDIDITSELEQIVSELRGGLPLSAEADVVVIAMPITPAVPRPVLEVPCLDCNAKPGERCASLLDASQYLETPHAKRRELAQNPHRRTRP